MIEWRLPIKTVSESNCQTHWTQKYKRHKAQKKGLSLALNEAWIVPSLPCKVTLIRIAPRNLDGDNLQGAFKHIRDIIADFLIPGLKPGRADGDPRIHWDYEQERGAAREYAIKILINSQEQ